MADREIEKISEDGITVGDMPLQEYLKQQEDEAKTEEVETDAKEAIGLPLYHKPRMKNGTMKKSSSPVKNLSRREINKEKWETLLMGTNNIDLAILQVLLSGKQMMGGEIRDYVLKNVPGTLKKSYDIRCSYIMRKTDLGKIVKIKRTGKGNLYQLVSAALDLRPEELRYFIYKDKDARAKILEQHKALTPYFEEQEPVTPEDVEDKTGKEVVESKTRYSNFGLQADADGNLNLNVHVSGRIEFIFKLGN